MSTGLRKWLGFLLILLLFLLHNDLWLWNNAEIVLGLPAGLLYHVLYCVAASLLLAGLVRYLWPSHLELDRSPEQNRE